MKECNYRHCNALVDGFNGALFCRGGLCRRNEHALRRNEVKQAKKKTVKYATKNCLCPCGKSFVDTSPNQNRTFYDRGICRYKYLKANKTYTSECKQRGRRDRTMEKDRPTEYQCHHTGLHKGCSIACADYVDRCLEMFAKNKTPECTGFKEPDTTTSTVGSAIGGSFALCVNRGMG